jgi:hypothetical protein
MPKSPTGRIGFVFSTSAKGQKAPLPQNQGSGSFFQKPHPARDFGFVAQNGYHRSLGGFVLSNSSKIHPNVAANQRLGSFFQNRSLQMPLSQ